MLDDTHDPALRSWVTSANEPGGDFPIQNLPLGVFVPPDSGDPRIGIAIGDRVLDVRAAVERGLLTGIDRAVLTAPTLNPLMAAGTDVRRDLRRRASALLRMTADERDRAAACLVSAADVRMQLPAAIGDYTDFYASIFHATNVGRMLRPDEPLFENYKYVPIGYHGRASSIVVSGEPIRRPSGQTKAESQMEPTFGPSRRLDYELEVGIVVGPGNPLGHPIPMLEAESHVFGYCLLNDWSARDVQQWEYRPLGPFLAKSFATTISPWLVTPEALAPFRVAAFSREPHDPQPLPYLRHDNPADAGIDIRLEVSIETDAMRTSGHAPHVIARSSTRWLYWTPAQLVAHHASNGCNLRPGDLLATGTVSGPTRESRGCLLELTSRGTEPLTLPSGEQRRFLEDGDDIIFRGWCERPGAVRIGFGTCRGRVIGTEVVRG